MAKIGRPKEHYKFKNFEKTYRIYERDYFRAARKKWNKLNGRKTNARIPRTVTKKDLQNVMYDRLLKRADFRQDYKAYKKELIDEGKENTNPIKYMIQDQTYQYSYKQYRGFSRAVRETEFKEETGLDLEDITEVEFREGKWRDEEFYDAARKYYYKMKEKAEELGKSGQNIWQYAADEVSKAFFGDSK